VVKSVGLRVEILITLTILLGAALLLGGIMMLHLMEKNLLQERVVQLDSLSQVLSQSIVLQVDQSNLFLNQQNLQLLTSLPATVHCTTWNLYDRELISIGSYGDGQGSGFSVARRQMAKLSGQSQHKVDFPLLLNLFDKSIPVAFYLVPIKIDNRFVGLLELQFSLADIRHNLLRSQQLMVIYVFLYGLVLVLAGYYLLQRNIIRPAKNLVIATDAVRRGNLDTRLPVAGPTEIMQLAIAYNQMVEALQASRGETQQQITSLENANNTLQQTRDELIKSEKMASVGQLAAGLAHEVGNPLAAVIGYLEVLRQRIKSIDEQDIIERTLVETKRIDYLVRELLDYARPATSSTVESVNLLDEIRASVKLLHNQGSFGTMDIVDNMFAVDLMVKCNRTKMQQVFINLLLNAVQSCSDNGSIELLAGCGSGICWLEISDNGCGIEPSQLDFIFDPFYTTKDPGQGTGLGLAICQRLIAEVNGQLMVSSQVGIGSTFRIEFSLVEC